MKGRNSLRLAFYADDFTGSTDALEQLARAGVQTMLFIAPPTRAQLKQFPLLEAVGVAGVTRSLPPDKMRAVLRPALKHLKDLGAPQVHYKVCSTFDSSPAIGSIGCVMELGQRLFKAPFIPLLVGAPALGRYCLFGNLFARMGIGSQGAIHRLDRHPSISRHPITPMLEADLRQHLAQQTKLKVALFDILQVALPAAEARAALRDLLAERPDAVLFDVLEAAHLAHIGGLLDERGSAQKPLFSVGSSGVEMALTAHWKAAGELRRSRAHLIKVRPVKQLLVGSGSCSPVTQQQMDWAMEHGFAEVALRAGVLAKATRTQAEMQRAVRATVALLERGRSVIVHTTRKGSDRQVAEVLQQATASVLGTALGLVLRKVLLQAKVRRVCIAGGDTSSFAARAMGIKALEMVAPLVPGAPLCRAFAPGSPADGLEVNFKGGQVGPKNYFGILKTGKLKT